MGNLRLASVAALVGYVIAAPTGEIEARQDAGGFAEYKTETSNLIYRIAIPDVTSAPFDVLLEIVAPVTVGWAGLGWGGGMLKNPLAVAWKNGDSVVVSSRWATAYSAPQAYASAVYTVLGSSTANSTHWQANVLCTGCSQWEGGALEPGQVNDFAWAMSTSAPRTPASGTSAIGYHQEKNHFSVDLSKAKVSQAQFAALVASLSGPPVGMPQPSAPAVPSSTIVLGSPTVGPLVPETPVVATSVVILPSAPVTSSSIVLGTPTVGPVVPDKPIVQTSVVILPPATSTAIVTTSVAPDTSVLTLPPATATETSTSARSSLPPLVLPPLPTVTTLVTTLVPSPPVVPSSSTPAVVVPTPTVTTKVTTLPPKPATTSTTSIPATKPQLPVTTTWVTAVPDSPYTPPARPVPSSTKPVPIPPSPSPSPWSPIPDSPLPRPPVVQQPQPQPQPQPTPAQPPTPTFIPPWFRTGRPGRPGRPGGRPPGRPGRPGGRL